MIKKPGPDNKKEVLYIRNLPVETKHKFKAWCASKGISMTDKILDLIRQTVKEK